ncbi:TRAP transporter substrate-binding protein [Maricurvus nonylphenolicus]|uniref:TRAP transporter substrate-binding protein n=1 Tax=Maricurvus nonylphenolicus TaxID=1008307 RepID=UPI0036F21F09
MGRLQPFIAGLIAVLVLTGCQQDKQTVLKLGHGLDQGHAVHKALVHLGERLDHYSAGEMRLDIYSGGQLGSEREMIELLQIGSLAMTKVSASPMEGFVPAMKVFSIPYVFRDHDHYWQFLDSGKGQDLLTSGDKYRLRGLAYYDAGSRSFYTTEARVDKPADLQGLKIRVQKSQTSVQMVETLGGAATPISWGELYTALQQGVVDGAENNPPSFYQSRHYEVSRYFVLDEHTSVPDIILISLPILQRLSEQEQGWLMQAVADSVVFQKQLWQTQTEEALAAVKAAGVEVIVPDKIPFQQAALTMHSSIENPEVQALIQGIKRMEASH